MNAIINKLWNKTDVGGIARYENDEYHRTSKEVPGNPWVISTLWLARWQVARATTMEELRKSLNLLTWTVKHALQTGVLAEQLHPQTGMPLSVSPLVWSHAEFIIATCEYLQKYDELSQITSNINGS
jgi:GH15 family glucan-1,4-alpha-glucosidase